MQVDTDGYYARLVEEYYEDEYPIEIEFCPTCQEETEFEVGTDGQGLCTCCGHTEIYFKQHDSYLKE